MPGDVLTSEELLSYALNGGAMPPKYVNASPATTPGPAAWRLLDAAHISTGIMDPNRLGTGATGAGNLYLADDGTWKLISAGGGGDMLKATYDVDNDGVVDSAERIEIIVRNSTGTTLTKGTVVYLSGATGNRPNALRSQANSEATSSKTIGIVVADITNNSDGYVAVNGTLHDLDTSAYADGAALWLSPTVAGGWTTTVPSEPNHSVFVGYVARSHPTQGRLVLHIQNGYELNELHDVYAPSPTNGDLLQWDSANAYWKNVAVATVVPTPTLAQVTTAGNTTNNSIGLGVASAPTYRLEVAGTTNAHAVRSHIGYDVYPVPDPTSLSGVISAGGSVDTGLHGYYLSFYTALGETHGFGPVSITTTAGNNTVTLTIPTSSDPRVIGRKLYRTKVGSAYNEYLLATITNNTATSYVDTAADSTLTTNYRGVYYRANTTANFLTIDGTRFMIADINATYFGIGAGRFVTSGGYNSFLGSYTGGSTTTGASNVFVGYLTGYLNTTGDANTVVGTTAYYAVTNGSNNVVIGFNAGRYIADNSTQVTSVNNGIYIGFRANVSATTGVTNEMVFGNQVTGLGSNTVVLGNDSIVRTALKGNVLIGTTTDAGYKLDVAGNTRVNGGNTSADTPFIINNRFQFKGDGVLLYGSAAGHGRLTWDSSGVYFGGLSGYGVGLGANTTTNHLFINTSGNVGIGTTSPGEKLQVAGNVHISGVGSALYFDTDASPKSIVQYVNNLYELHIYNGRGITSRIIGGNSFVSLGSGTTQMLYLNTSSGNVLIGTTTDGGYKLDVNGSSRATSFVKTGGTSAQFLKADGSVDSNAYITSAGNAATATTLQTARNINGTSFNGSADITTAVWGNARTLTIGNTGKSVNGSGNVSWTLGEIQAEYQVPNNTLRNNLGDPTVREAAMFHGQFNNKFRFISPTLQEESNDGITWTTSTRASAANLGDMMRGEGEGTSFSAIPIGTMGTYGGYRLTWSVVGTVGYVFLNALYVYNSTNGNNVTIKIEAYHNTTGWTTITGPHTTNNWPGHAYIPHSPIYYSNNASQYSQARITFETTRNAFTNAFSIYSIEWVGGYPAGKRNAESYDRDKNVTFPANITSIGALTSTGAFTANSTSTFAQLATFNNSAIFNNSPGTSTIRFQHSGTDRGIFGIDGGIYGVSTANIGLYVYGVNDLELSTNGTKRLIAKGNGNILIGTTTDSGYKLDVNGSARVTTNLIVDGSVGIGIANPVAKYHQYQAQGIFARYDISNPNTNQHRGVWDFYTNAAVAPDFFGRFGFKFEGGVSDAFKQFQINIADSTTPKMVVTGGGLVGIGTIAPVYKVDVQGTTLATSTISAQGAFNIARVAAPTGTLTLTPSTGGSIDVGQHYYFVSFVTAIGETTVALVTGIIIVSGTQTVTITGIPTSTDARVTGRRIYRTRAGQTSDRGALLTTINDNTTTSYVDTVADSTLPNTGDWGYYRENTTSRQITIDGTRAMLLGTGLTSIGFGAGASVTTAGLTTLVGYNAGNAITYGFQNTLVGTQAGRFITTADGNTALGAYTLMWVTTGADNIAIGRGAIFYNVTGSYNIAVGGGALSGQSGASHSSNIAIGNAALANLGAASNNVALGYYAGRYISSGSANTLSSNSIFIGYDARPNADSEANQIVIGYNARGLGSNTTVIGNSSTTFTSIPAGNLAVGTTTNAGFKLDVNGTARVQGAFTATLANVSTANVVYYNSSTGLMTYATAPIGAQFVIDYDYNIVGLKNGSNVLFTTSATFIVNTTRVFLNGQRLTRGAGYDYIETGTNQITFTNPPVSTDLIIIEYQI